MLGRERHFPENHPLDNELKPMAAAVYSSNGQEHDRIDRHSGTVKMAATQPVDIAVGGGSDGVGGSDVLEITVGQRMMSAMSGSLLTSLLGKYHVANCRV